MELTIKPLTNKLVDDFLYFFDHRAFCNHPEWASCYCTFYQIEISLDLWENRNAVMNRKEAEKQIKGGKLKGFLAYHNDKPIGFCNVNEKKEFTFDKYRFEINSTGTENIISIVCFVIDPDFRRKGISKAFLEQVINTYSISKKKIIETYPSINVSDEASNYHGFYEMYKKKGFEEQSSYDKYCIMHLKPS